MRAKCMYCGRFVRDYRERPAFLAALGWTATWTCSKCGDCEESI